MMSGSRRMTSAGSVMILLDEWRSACREGGINGKRFPEVLDALKAKGVLQTTGNLVKPRK